ncbi:MAG: hypothetical protein FJX54_10610 [Alphaproteobacteria bacterium]|nr:hypothetical protein [Alphaproteobacteria bacterium]
MTRIRTLLAAAAGVIAATAVTTVAKPASADTCYDRYGRPYACYYYDRPARYYAPPPPRYYYPPPPRYYYPPPRPGFSFYFSN